MEDVSPWTKLSLRVLPDTALGLALGRNPALLRRLLERLSLPEGAERVALSLEVFGVKQAREKQNLKNSASYLLASREGVLLGFTGEEPPNDAFPILWDRLAPFFTPEKHEMGEELMQAWGQELEEGAVRHLAPLLEAGDRLSREKMAAFLLWQPLLDQVCFFLLGEIALRLEDARTWFAQREERLSLAYTSALRSYHSMLFAAGHLAVLAAAGGHRPWMDKFSQGEDQLNFFLDHTVRQGVTSISLRGCWSFGQVGRPWLSTYLKKAQKVLLTQEVTACLLGLMMLGLGQRENFPRVEEALHAAARVPKGLSLGKARKARLELKASYVKAALELINREPKTLLETQRARARNHAATLSKLPAGSPYRAERSEDLPDDLLGALLIDESNDYMSDMRHIVLMMSMPQWLCLAGWEQLYLPEEVLQIARPFWRPEETLLALSSFLSNRITNDEPPPSPPPPPKMGRNELCRCGSGKKYKRCCGAN